MLAEPKRKTVWSTNPRGKYWSEDKNKLGHKLLESMGWKEGMGLGKHTNGIKEHIRVDINADNRGLGYKPSTDVWIDKNADYEQLLADLAVHHNNGSDRKQEKVSNLEEVSKKIKSRLHYHKLIKAKNLSQCSEKDLNSIFPKTNKSIANDMENKDSVKDVNQKTNTFESTKNINEYFKSKLDKLKLKCHLFDKSLSNEENEKQGLLLSFDSEILNDSNDDRNTKRKLEDEEQDVTSQSISDSNVRKNRKPKKNKRNKEKIEMNGNEFEINDKDSQHSLESETSADLNNNGCNVSLEGDEQELFSEANLNVKKSKKNKKSKDKNYSQIKGNELEVNNNNESNETKAKKPRKTKKLKTECSSPKSLGSLESSNLSSEDSNKSNEMSQNYEIRVPKGYLKSTLSVSESVKNYQQLCLAINKDKVLSTSSLMSIKGYGCHSD